MRLTSLLLLLAASAGILAHYKSRCPVHIGAQATAATTLGGKGHDRPSKMWPKPLQDDWWCMKKANVSYPQMHGDWRRKKEGVHTGWGFPGSCCGPFAKAWREYEHKGKTRGIRAVFFVGDKEMKAGEEGAGCDRVVMSRIKGYHWPYVNRFWGDFGVFPGQEE